MAKVLVNESSLSGIAEAIREKSGSTEVYKPSEMAAAIIAIPSGGGGEEPEPIVLTADCSYACKGDIPSNYIKLYGNTISTKDITNANSMFFGYKNDYIPFDINFRPNTSNISTASFFRQATNLKQLPKALNLYAYDMQYFFSECQNIRDIPDDYFDTWDFSKMTSATSAYLHSANSMFWKCYSLRKLPVAWLKNMNPIASYNYTYFVSGFAECFTLDELVNLPIPYTATYTTNLFGGTFSNCNRLKNFTFETNEDGTPKVVNWKGQTMSFRGYIGYNSIIRNYTQYNSGITADKEVKDDATYQALKDNPDWFATKIEYCRYNHDSAVNTINSLPDTSAYLASAGGTNTITFSKDAGSKTDGGAISTLTEQEIAVATAKGWTVTMA